MIRDTTRPRGSRPLPFLFAPLLLPLLVGCSTPTYTFQVAVRNECKEPLTLWLTKDGPPAEADWLSPEQVARAGFDADTAGHYEFLLPPGKARATSPLKGQFPEGVHPVLRVYRGALTKMGEILATSRGEPTLRLDLVLQHVGLNRYVVRDDAGRLVAAPPDQPWPITGGETPDRK